MTGTPYKELKEHTFEANIGLVKAGLVILTWGNASSVDSSRSVMAIKPSGVPYSEMKPDDIVIMAIDDGRIIEGRGRPSSDAPTHLHLYRSWPAVRGVIHTHSTAATSFAQAGREIPCLGTTHADNFHGTIPLTRILSDEEIQSDYELNTGKVIVETFSNRGINPSAIPGILVNQHAPFAWGETAEKSLENAIVLETCADMAARTFILNHDIKPLHQTLLDKHFLRKHGPGAYYGQEKTGEA